MTTEQPQTLQTQPTEPAVHDTWVVIPLFNEAEVIGDVIRDLRQTFPQVVCVDDGSSDDSARLAREAGARVVQHPVNLGQGAALQTGFDYALSDPAMKWVVTFDADGQHQVADALAMVERLRAGDAEVVFGSRFLDERTEAGLAKKLVLRAAVGYTNMTTHTRLTDAHNGLRAMSRSVVEKVEITQNRMAHASELVAQIGASGATYVEQPVHILYTDYSRSKGQSLWNSINILAELILR
ncbi:glycosyl transferase family 2 [Oryzihumus leptocrescens]|uniref:Glycosyl transferase family 2 n=1 Tax=Oryzihumus leptocrescens TaxID=297536 RepID=A0A542ZGC6_9MICO|nr:glycosyl transferase family 2 [Oryzihumus leptocrescens]